MTDHSATPQQAADAAAIERLQVLVRIPTVSHHDTDLIEWHHFDHLIDTLPTLYPLVHTHLERDRIAGHSLLYRWRGNDDGEPAVFMAHYDVVPATDEGWEHPPFSAEITGDGADRTLWGRGTLDDKGSMAAILQAVEDSLAAGIRPRNDIYLSFGHNEETAGDGAIAIVDHLRARGIRPALVSDEGGAVVEGIFPGVDSPIAVVGVAEKGLTDLTLTVEQQGGHASTPPRLAATARLARAITRLDARPQPARFTPTTLEMIRTLGAHARGPLRWAFTNLWLTRPLLRMLFARLSDETAAIIRTTQVVTRLEGSMASNALAERARATVNMRIAVGSSVAEAVDHVRRAIDDPLVRLDAAHPSEPTPVSPTHGAAWDAVSAAIAEIHPEAIVTPYVMLGATDSRHFTTISDNVYRFSPFEMSSEERATLHARNERIRVDTFLRGIGFYRALIRAL